MAASPRRIQQCTSSFWRHGNSKLSLIEKYEAHSVEDTLAAAASTTGQRPRYDFVGLHNIAKHIIHLRESSQGATVITERFQEFHRELLKHPPQGQAALPVMTLADQVLSQKVIQMDAWKLRMQSLDRRVQNMINLVSVASKTCDTR